jgi:hypothetical protein
LLDCGGPEARTTLPGRALMWTDSHHNQRRNSLKGNPVCMTSQAGFLHGLWQQKGAGPKPRNARFCPEQSSRSGEKKLPLPQSDDQQKHDHSHDQNRNDCSSVRSVVFVYAQSINPLTPRKWDIEAKPRRGNRGFSAPVACEGLKESTDAYITNLPLLRLFQTPSAIHWT